MGNFDPFIRRQHPQIKRLNSLVTSKSCAYLKMTWNVSADHPSHFIIQLPFLWHIKNQNKSDIVWQSGFNNLPTKLNSILSLEQNSGSLGKSYGSSLLPPITKPSSLYPYSMTSQLFVKKAWFGTHIPLWSHFTPIEYIYIYI